MTINITAKVETRALVLASVDRNPQKPLLVETKEIKLNIIIPMAMTMAIIDKVETLLTT